METSVLKCDAEIKNEMENTSLDIELGLIVDDIKLLKLRLAATHYYVEMLQKQLNEAIELEQELDRQLKRQCDNEVSVREKILLQAANCEPNILVQVDLQNADDDESANDIGAVLELFTGQPSKMMTIQNYSFKPANVNDWLCGETSSIAKNPTGDDMVDKSGFSCTVEQSSNSSQNRYPCQMCHQLYATPKIVGVHMKRHCKLRPQLPLVLKNRFETSSIAKNPTGGEVGDKLDVSCTVEESSNSSRKRYPCQLCGQLYATPKIVGIHVKNHCKLRPQLPLDLKQRIAAYRFHCPKCQQKFCSKQSLKRHLRVKGRCKGKQRLLSPDKQPTNSNDSVVETQILAEEDTVNKDTCVKVVNDDLSDSDVDKWKEQQAVRTGWQSYFYQCPYCKLCYTKKRDLQIHLIKDAECHATYVLQQKVQKVTLRRKYITKQDAHLIVGDSLIPKVQTTKSTITSTSCYACGRTDVVEWSIYRTSSHRICLDCKKLFLDRSAVDNTEYSEYAECIEPSDPKYCFTCLTCKKGYTNIQSVFVHLRSHTGYRPHICYKCGASYHNSETLRVHILQHDPDNSLVRIECDMCLRNFPNKQGLKDHKVRVHSSERPFVCSVCGKAYGIGYELQIHMRNHTGVRPYACSMCPKAFIMTCHLKKHIRNNHVFRKPERCPVCFKEVLNMGRHHKEMHLGIKRCQFRKKIDRYSHV